MRHERRIGQEKDKVEERDRETRKTGGCVSFYSMHVRYVRVA